MWTSCFTPIGPLEKANKLSDMPDFNAEKLGSGKEKVDQLTNLIAIFENKALDFSKNRADGDDILGDPYEIPHAPLRHRERQEHGLVLHPGLGQPHHGADHRHPRRGHDDQHHRLRPYLRLRLTETVKLINWDDRSQNDFTIAVGNIVFDFSVKPRLGTSPRRTCSPGVSGRSTRGIGSWRRRENSGRFAGSRLRDTL
jgi:hypothetical protein